MILGIIIGLGIGSIGGFIAGILVYRNNMKKLQERESVLREKYETAQAEIARRINLAKEVVR